jgi:hypothetical protein
MSYEDVAAEKWRDYISERNKAYEIVLSDLRQRRAGCQLAIEAITALRDYLQSSGWTPIVDLYFGAEGGIMNKNENLNA